MPGLDRDRRAAGLVAAARGGHLDTVKLLLQSTEEYCGPDWVSLVEAAREAGEFGHHGILTMLTRELFQRPSNKPPPSSLLFRAVFLGLEGVAETLLDLGADANSKLESDMNRTPLHVAMTQNQVAMTQNRVTVLDVLVRRGGQVTAELEVTGYHPLHIASNNGYVECAKALLDANPSESEVEAGSNIPLVLAAEEGNFRVVEVLLEHDQRRRRTPEDTAAGYGKALHMAAKLGYRRTADLLLG
ncbi:ankyrin repeat domain-containing protein, partial [Candidatus Bathyarchaeota archaeon]|nr:ankyrin repeat domain-containing protein [Candidatus Bathyarchaeota archaeon]